MPEATLTNLKAKLPLAKNSTVNERNDHCPPLNAAKKGKDVPQSDTILVWGPLDQAVI